MTDTRISHLLLLGMTSRTYVHKGLHFAVYFGWGTRLTRFICLTLNRWGFKYTRSPYVRCVAIGPIVVGRCDLDRI